MSKALNYILKGILIILYPVFVALTIAFAALLFIRTNEINQASAKYNEIHDQYFAEEAKPETLTEKIEFFASKFSEQSSEINELNSQLEKSTGEIEGAIVKRNYGQINGEIIAFVTGGGSVSQYQRVCAENVQNTNQQYCLNVSSSRREFSLVVPTGEYYVFAQLIDPNLSEEVLSRKAYYTELVVCQSEQDNCSESLASKKIKVTVQNGQTVENVQPKGWNIEGL